MRTILVVDDSAVDRRMACEILAANDHWRVVDADSGPAAIQILESHDVDLVITDLLMAPMNGIGLIRWVIEHRKHTPIVIMTSMGNDILAVQALKGGAASYVAKRRLQHDLVEVVSQVLALSPTDSLTNAGAKEFIVRSQTTYMLDNDIRQIRTLIAHLHDQVNRDRFTGSEQRLASIGFSEAERLQVNMALYEALFNAMRHGNLEIDPDLDVEAALQVAEQRRRSAPYKFRNIHVAVSFTSTEATYAIRDEGKGFPTPRQLSQEETFDERSGKGIPLMMTIMDEVRYNETGNEVTLVKSK